MKQKLMLFLLLDTCVAFAVIQRMKFHVFAVVSNSFNAGGFSEFTIAVASKIP